MSREYSNNLIKSADFIQSLERGLSVIQSFSTEHSTLTVSEAAAITNLSRPAIRRIFLTLESLGYLTSDNGRYALTAKVLSLGYAYLSSKNIWEIAHDPMDELVKQTGESTSISVLDHDEIVYVARIHTKRIMTMSLGVGSRLPAFATSMGQVLLAHLPSEELEEYFEQAILSSYTNHTITDKKQLIKQLEQIRKNGWSLAEQQFEEGLSSVAAPITNRNGEVIAAINISTHTGRNSRKEIKEKLIPLLLQTAQKISEDLARSPHPMNL